MVAEVEAFLEGEIADIEATRARGEEVWPVVDYADVEAGTVSDETLALVKRRGCAVVRGHFDRAQAERLGRRRRGLRRVEPLLRDLRRPGRRLLRHPRGRDEQARDLPGLLVRARRWRRARTRAWRRCRRSSTARWTSESEGRRWFDPEVDTLYPDRIRRRPPGATSGGLGTHLDPGTLDLWMTEGYQQHFRHLFSGDVAAYDPWDAAYRTEAAQYPGSTMCSAFRTFQGWTALSEMRRDQGVLHTVPIPKAMAYLMLRPLLDDVPAEEMCGGAAQPDVPGERALPRHPDPGPLRHPRRRARRLRLVALRHDPRGRPGDGPAGLGQRHLHPGRAAVRQERRVRRLACARRSCPGGARHDFPEEHYEASWPEPLRARRTSTRSAGAAWVSACRRLLALVELARVRTRADFTRSSRRGVGAHAATRAATPAGRCCSAGRPG